MLAEKGAYPGFPGTANSHLTNPLVDLPIRLSEIANVNAVIVTHTHLDHWDDAAKSELPKNLPVFVQNGNDRKLIQSSGFTDVSILTENTSFNGVKLIKTPGQHGSDEALKVIGELMGEVCGAVFDGPDEKRLYKTGDQGYDHDGGGVGHNGRFRQGASESTSSIILIGFLLSMSDFVYIPLNWSSYVRHE